MVRQAASRGGGQLHVSGQTASSYSGAVLAAKNISKSFAGVQALKDACFELHAGEVHALIGENGAGKSTLIKIITGAVQSDNGEITLNGQTIVDNSPRLAKGLGIAAIYQQPALFPELTVAENIALGLEQSHAFSVVKWGERRRIAKDLLARVGAKINSETTAGELSMPQQLPVVIDRALCSV